MKIKEINKEIETIKKEINVKENKIYDLAKQRDKLIAESYPNWTEVDYFLAYSMFHTINKISRYDDDILIHWEYEACLSPLKNCFKPLKNGKEICPKKIVMQYEAKKEYKLLKENNNEN